MRWLLGGWRLGGRRGEIRRGKVDVLWSAVSIYIILFLMFPQRKCSYKNKVVKFTGGINFPHR